jgi:hypothetical protein
LGCCDRSPELLGYNVYRDAAGTTAIDQPVARFWHYVGLRGELLCSGSHQPNIGPPDTEIIEPGTYAVRAVDSAGNEDQNPAVVEIPAQCGSGAPDSETEASGCTISRAGSSRDISGFALLGGFLLVGFARRPRRAFTTNDSVWTIAGTCGLACPAHFGGYARPPKT